MILVQINVGIGICGCIGSRGHFKRLIDDRRRTYAVNIRFLAMTHPDAGPISLRLEYFEEDIRDGEEWWVESEVSMTFKGLKLDG